MLLSVLTNHAQARDGAIAVIEPDGTERTYAELVDAGSGIAGWLRADNVNRFGLSLTSPTDVISVLAGASRTGAEPCNYGAAVSGTDADALAARFDHDLLITDRDVVVSNCATATIQHTPSQVDEATASPILILTTGTTGAPKGARHDWRRLISAAVKRPTPSDARWLLAYNVHQFAGVQILAHVLGVGAILVVPASISPDDAAVAIESHGVTHASATPTFWRFLLPRLKGRTAELPLSQITLGGEAPGQRLLDDLRAAFPAARITHIYAATEVGSAISVGDGEIGLPVSVLDRSDDADVQFKIVQDELWTRSRVGMLGYYGDQAGGADGDWRPTGDVVRVEADRIVFVGRTSDVINVGGVKVHPLPIEEIVTHVPDVVASRVYGRKNPMTGSIVAVDVITAPGADADAVEQRIRDACQELPAAARPRRIRFVDDLEVRGGKVVRGTEGQAP